MRMLFYILFSFFSAVTFLACNDGDKSVDKQISEDRRQESTKRVDTKSEEQKYIVFFGNSLTAGYGLDPSETFPALIGQRLDSLGYDHYKVVNAGVSGETTAGGKSRIDWLLQRQPVNIFVLELGANDGLRGIDPAQTKQNLEAIIEKVRKKNPEVEIILAGMMVPPSMGKEYSQRFSQIFVEIAREKNVELIPFLLENVAGEPALNQADGIHPTARGQKVVAHNVWEVLSDVIREQERVEN